MMEMVTATRFERQMTSGKTKPCLLTCECEDGSEVEVIAKFSKGCERGVGALIVEAFCAMLATDLDLWVPKPLLVTVDDNFIQSLHSQARDAAAQMRASSRVAFGSTRLSDDFTVWLPDTSITPSLRQDALEVFAFDCLINNPDRRLAKPNLLFDGSRLAIIDHELALMTEGTIGWQNPWVLGALTQAAPQHLFFARLRGHRASLERLLGAWSAISDQRLNQYLATLPPEWIGNGQTAREALAYLRSLRDNAKAALDEVARVLS
jgi:hypothetical protein